MRGFKNRGYLYFKNDKSKYFWVKSKGEAFYLFEGNTREILCDKYFKKFANNSELVNWAFVENNCIGFLYGDCKY